MSPLDFHRRSCFPDGPNPNNSPDNYPDNSLPTFENKIDTISRSVKTLPRETAYNLRHPVNQGGMIVRENGTVEIRSSGKSALVLTQDHITIISDGKIGVAGGFGFAGKPSEELTFLRGTYQLNPFWEQKGLILTPKVDITTLYVYQKVKKDLVPILLTDAFSLQPLYIKK